MTSIDMLPDDVLLEIFDFYVNKDKDGYFKSEKEAWQTLVHVCRRWRSVVFRSPRRLKLRLVCTSETPARDTLDLWPSLPLVILDSNLTADDEINEILAVLERSDRVVGINLIHVDVDGSNLETVLAAMQVPFPELTHLSLWLQKGMESDLPDSLLGGSAPRLESLWLDRISFSGLPKFLLSATHLVTLRLHNIPHSGYISPEVIVAVLSMLTSLESLSLGFKSPLSRPDWANRRLPPPTRSVLPVLVSFRFQGVCEYLEDVVTRINAPRVNELDITLFNQILFDMPQFTQFVGRSPAFETLEEAHVVFEDDAAEVTFLSQTSGSGILMKIPCVELDWQVSSMEQVCNLCLSPISALADLYIYEHPNCPPVWQDNIENTLWLELLQPFIGVTNLSLSEKFASLIIPALQELTGGRTTEVLPTLQNIFLQEHRPSETLQAGIQQFAATRQVTGHPIAVSRWDNSEDKEHA